MADFAIEFCTLAAESGWNTEAMVTAFHQGLSNSIKDELASLELGVDLDSLIMLAIRIENRLREQVRQRFSDTIPVSSAPQAPRTQYCGAHAAETHMSEPRRA